MRGARTQSLVDIDDSFTNRQHGYANKFDVLVAEGNADDGDEVTQRYNQVPQCQPEASDYEPGDIADHAQET